MNDLDVIAVYMAKGLIICAFLLGVVAFIEDFLI